MRLEEKKKYESPKVKVFELSSRSSLLSESKPGQDEIEVIKI